MRAARMIPAACAVLGGCPAAGWAQEAELTARSPWALLAQALLSLAVVVALIYLVYFGARRLTDRHVDAHGDGPMRVIQARHLGGDRWLYLVEIDGRRLVIGGASGQIAPIAELGAPGGERRDEV